MKLKGLSPNFASHIRPIWVNWLASILHEIIRKIYFLWFTRRGSREQKLICLNLIDVRSEIWWSLTIGRNLSFSSSLEAKYYKWNLNQILNLDIIWVLPGTVLVRGFKKFSAVILQPLPHPSLWRTHTFVVKLKTYSSKNLKS